jgi:cobalamin biosynthesis Mg chelatase CobN
MTQGLSDSEREELEALRREKAAREAAQREQVERAELEALRRERARVQQEAAAEKDQLEREARASKMMQPDEDLNMPVAQKALIAALIVVFVIAVVYMFVLPH